MLKGEGAYKKILTYTRFDINFDINTIKIAATLLISKCR